MGIPFGFFVRLAMDLPDIIKQGVELAQDLREPGKSKKQKVLDSILPGLGLTEDVVGKDILDDDVIKELKDAYLEAEVAVVKAREALQKGILAKAGA